MFKIKVVIFSLFMLSAGISFAQVSFGESQKIDDGWRFHLGDLSNAQSVTFNDVGWQKVDLPHDWSVKQALSQSNASCQGYLPAGIGWYRKNLVVPKNKQGKKIYIYFEGVYNRSEVYLNGHLLGKRPNGYVSFMYDATPYIKYGASNAIAVRVDHSKAADSRWYTGSGIYRDVWLVYANPIHFAQWGVSYTTPKINKSEATVTSTIEIENGTDSDANLTVLSQLLSTNGTVIAKSSQKLVLKAKQTGKQIEQLQLKNPQLWQLDNPYLYQLKTVVLENGNAIDETTIPVGIRTMTFDPNTGFALNGENIKMKGVCIHHDAGVLGSAVPPEVWEKRLMQLKSLGCNAIRLSHNPQAPKLYDLCDSLGILVLDEGFDEWKYPKRKWLTGWNHGTPGYEGSYDFFEEWSDQDMKDIVRRDRNHPCVFAWSIGNEVDYPNDPYSHPILNGAKINQPMFGGYKKDAPNAAELGVIAKRLVADVKSEDTSRPVTAALAGVIMSNETDYPGALDICGYNYTENRYDEDHAKYPQRVIYGSENGQSMDAWKAVRDNKNIFGQFLWTGFDYLGESGTWPSRGLCTGLIDFASNVKPRGYFRRALWSDKTVTYLGTYPCPNDKKNLSIDALPIWNYSKGQLIRVVCYTNAEYSSLTLNGKQLGDVKKRDDETGIIYWDVPYEDGILKVEGADALGSTSKACSYQIQTAQSPAALIAKVDQTSISKNKGLAQIDIQVVDKNGVLVELANNEVTCTIEGTAKFLGLESGSNTDMSDKTDNKEQVNQGRLLAYIQATGRTGSVKVKFSSPSLKSAEVTIRVK